MTSTRNALPIAAVLIAAGLGGGAVAAPALGSETARPGQPLGVQVAQMGGGLRRGPDMNQQPGWARGGGMGQGMGQGMGRGMGRGSGMGPSAGMMMQGIDSDGDGRVSGAEFMAWHDGVFAAMDADGSGTVTKEEFMAVRMGPGAGQGPMAEEMQAAEAAAFDRADSDGDGTISADQFTDLAAAEFTAADADGDGALTAGEFGGMHMMR